MADHEAFDFVIEETGFSSLRSSDKVGNSSIGCRNLDSEKYQSWMKSYQPQFYSLENLSFSFFHGASERRSISLPVCTGLTYLQTYLLRKICRKQFYSC